MQLEREHQEEQRRRAEQKRVRLENEQKRLEEEREHAQWLAAAELLIVFSEQVKEQASQTEPCMMKDECVQTLDSVESLEKENDILRKKLQEERFGVATI